MAKRRKLGGIGRPRGSGLRHDPAIIKRIKQFGLGRNLTPKQIFNEIAKEGKQVSLGSIYYHLGEMAGKRRLKISATQTDAARIMKVSAISGIEYEKLGGALQRFYKLTFPEKLRRLNQANVTISELRDAIFSETSEQARERMRAKLDELEALLNLFCQYMPKDALKEIGIGFNE